MERDTNVNLKWDAHQTTLKSVFDSLLDTESLADCTVGAEGQHLKAHKIMLSACSRYFELLFKNHYGKHVIIVLPGVQFHVLKALMEFMYRGVVLVPQGEIDALLQLADFLQVKGLSFDGNVVSGKKSADKSPTYHCRTSPESYEPCDSPELLEVSGSSTQSESLQKRDYTKVTPISAPTRKRKKSNWHLSTEEPRNKQDFVPLSQTIPRNSPLHESEVPDKTKSACGRFSDREPRLSHEIHLPVFSEGNFSETKISGRELISAKPLNTGRRKGVCPTVRRDNTNLETFAEPKQENCSLDDVIPDTDNQHQNICDDKSFLSNELTESSFCDGESFSQQLQFQNTEWTNTPGEQTSAPCSQFDPTEHTSASDIRFKCQSCNRSYRHYRDLQRHLKYECGKEPQFQCSMCSLRVKHKHQLKAHMATHTYYDENNLQSLVFS